MSGMESQKQEANLFDSISGGAISISLRKFDESTAEGELRFRVDEVKKRVEKLEKSEVIPHELLEATISI